MDDILTAPASKVHKYSQTVVDTTDSDWTYDDSGNFTGVQGGAAYVYNAQNRMAEYVPGPGDRDAERWEYVYDGFGRRVRKVHVVEGEVAAYFDFAYDGDQVIAEYASTAAVPSVPERTFVYGAYIDEPIAMDVAGERYYFVSGATRSIALLLGESEPGVWSVVERYAYEDFGEAIILDAAGAELAASAFGNPYFFQGRRFDAELGLYYYRNRYYDPIHGRFTSRDPLGFWGDPANMGNPYAFVANNPWTYLDPWGLCGKKREELERQLERVRAERDSDRWGAFLDDVWDNKEAQTEIIGVFHPGGDVARAGIAWEQGDYWGTGENLIAVIPLIGDGGKYASKGLRKLLGVGAQYGDEMMMGVKQGAGSLPYGAHTNFRRNPSTGRVTHYETVVPQTNPHNPNPWELQKRFDGIGKGHFNKADQAVINTPHVHDPRAPGGVRVPFENELPKGY